MYAGILYLLLIVLIAAWLSMNIRCRAREAFDGMVKPTQECDATSGICFKRIDKEDSEISLVDPKKKLQITADTTFKNAVCVGATCVDEADLKRLKDMPQSVQTKEVNFGAWKARPEVDDKAFVIRNKQGSGNDYRYAMFENQYKDL